MLSRFPVRYRILIISFSPLDRDPRVRRQIFCLVNAGYHVTAAGFTDPEIDGVEWWPVTMPDGLLRKVISGILLKLRQFKIYYRFLPQIRSFRKRWRQQRIPFDLLIANDIEALPVAIEVAEDRPVFFDAHEYSPQELDGWMFNFFFARLRD